MADIIGRSLGNYRITELIARGGMGAVYKAYQVSLDRYVALKILPESFAYDATLFDRFEQEAKSAARLRHPSITQVIDFGRDGDLVYLVMEYVGGGTLQQRLKQPLDLATGLTLARQVAEALGYAHARGIVHRDVKPSNILLTSEGHAVLSDFGIAKVIERQVALTRAGMGVGTPEYMAPEQAQGIGVDARADIYSLGIVLFQMTTGRVPFESDTPLGVVLKHLTEPLPMPRSINPDVPEAVEKIIVTCLAKSPADRYESADALIKAIDAVLAASRTSTSLPVADAQPTLVGPAVVRPATPAAPAAKAATAKRQPKRRPEPPAKPAPGPSGSVLPAALAPTMPETPAPVQAAPVTPPPSAPTPAARPAAAAEASETPARAAPSPEVAPPAVSEAAAPATPEVALPAVSEAAVAPAPTMPETPPPATPAPVRHEAPPQVIATPIQLSVEEEVRAAVRGAAAPQERAAATSASGQVQAAAAPAASKDSGAAKPALDAGPDGLAQIAQPWPTLRRARPSVLSGAPLVAVGGAALVLIVVLVVGALAVSAMRGRGAAAVARATTPTGLPAVLPTSTVAVLATAISTLPVPPTAIAAPATATASAATPTARPTAPAGVTPAIQAPTSTRAATSVPTAPPVAAANTPASLSGRIAFTIFRGPDKYGDFDIGLLDATGTAPRQVTQFGSFPVFSPDGQRILYYSWVEVGLYTMNSSGREQIGLPGTMDDSVPAWSPDGKRIAVVHGDAIWVMNADGSGRTKIIDEGDLPSWSPDSKQLVYQGCVAGDCGLAIADADGKNQRIITKGAGDTSPAWHPTGESILFTSRRSGQMEVWLTNVQGATARALTDSLRTPAGERASSGAATWSPDGKTIIFRSNRDGSWGIYIMNADGSGQRKIAVANASDEWWRERVSATK